MRTLQASSSCTNVVHKSCCADGMSPHPETNHVFLFDGILKLAGILAHPHAESSVLKWLRSRRAYSFPAQAPQVSGYKLRRRQSISHKSQVAHCSFIVRSPDLAKATDVSLSLRQILRQCYLFRRVNPGTAALQVKHMDGQIVSNSHAPSILSILSQESPREKT